MALIKDLFSTSRTSKFGLESRDATASQDDALGGIHGPETRPVKMNLEERMAFRRELLYETIRASLTSRIIPANTYRFKVMRTDKRGHCFVVMFDMSPTFMASPAGQHASLNETAALLVKNAEIKYGLQVGGVYWRSDETLDASIANWARPSASAPHAPNADSERQGSIEISQGITVGEMLEFEASRLKDSALQIDERRYVSDLAPLMEDLRHS